MSKINLKQLSKEIKLLERTRKIKYAKDILLSIVDGQPIEIGEHIEKERL